MSESSRTLPMRLAEVGIIRSKSSGLMKSSAVLADAGFEKDFPQVHLQDNNSSCFKVIDSSEFLKISKQQRLKTLSMRKIQK